MTDPIEGPRFIIPGTGGMPIFLPYRLRCAYWHAELGKWVFEFDTGAVMLVSPEYLESLKGLGKPVIATL